MAVTVTGEVITQDGHKASIRVFRDDHNKSSAQLLNQAEGKDVDDPRPAYDPAHPDNQWPVMLYHPQFGEKTVGQSLKGVVDDAENRTRRAQLQDKNKGVLQEYLSKGWRKEPYAKPVVQVADAATEKAALQKKLDEQQGQIVELSDMVKKLLASQSSPPDTPPAVTDVNKPAKFNK